jgi:Transcriptional regulators
MFNFERIQTVSVSEQVYDQLRDNIIEKIWLPGTKLPSENNLAKMFNVSRVSIRSAIQKLIALGMLETRTGEGTFVKKISPSIYLNPLVPMLILDPAEIVELLEFRKGLEMQSCELAAIRRTPEEVELLGSILQKMIQYCGEDNLEQFSVEDFNFHTCIARMSKNSVIEHVILMLKEPMFKHLEEMNKRFGLDSGLTYHQEIYEAIKREDPKAASFFIEAAIKQNMNSIEQLGL